MHRAQTPARTDTELDDARLIAATLPRSYEALARDQVRFRVGRLVYAAFYHDDTIMGFGFPRGEREALVASEPDKLLMPRPSDLRFRWVCVRLDAIDVDELRELLVDAWRMCVANTVAADYEGWLRQRAAVGAVPWRPPRNRSVSQNDTARRGPAGVRNAG